MENNPGLKNRQGEVLITRLFIRYVTRLFGYCNASAIFSKFVYLLRKLFGLNFDNYSMYILQINIFDFYLTKNAYNSRYPTSLISKNGVINNQEICTSLIEHDALYNFLYVKKMSEILNIKESKEFINIVNMTGQEYVKKLVHIRNFSGITHE